MNEHVAFLLMVVTYDGVSISWILSRDNVKINQPHGVSNVTPS